MQSNISIFYHNLKKKQTIDPHLFLTEGHRSLTQATIYIRYK